MQPEEKPQRTPQQQKAIEVFCRELAKALNSEGLDQRKVFEKMKEGVDIPWSQESVKETLWRKVQVAMLEKESTADLETDEVSQVYKVLDRWTSQTLGIHVEFPDRFSQAEEKRMTS